MQPDKFDVPFGYTDIHGTVHKTVVIRRSCNNDLIAVAEDPRIKALAREGVKLDLSGLDSLISKDKPVLSDAAGFDSVVIETLQKPGANLVNPVEMMRLGGIMTQMNIIQFARIIVSIGPYKQGDNGVDFEDILGKMHNNDLAVIQGKVDEFNKPPIEKKPEDKKAPLDSGSSSAAIPAT